MSSNLFDVLVLGPGGDKGTVELGAMQYVQIKGGFSKLKVVAGVSIGAIIGLLYLCGYSIDEILKIALETEFIDQNNTVGLKNIFEKKGLFTQKFFEEKLTKLVKAKFGIVPNLLQLYQSTGIEFMCVVSNIKADVPAPEYFTYKNEPYLSCVQSVLMSANMLFVFEKKEYKNGVYLDGALTNPCPIDQYDFDGNKILAISVLTYPKSDFNFVEYALRAIATPMAQLREVICRYASKNVVHLKIFVDVNTSLGLFSKQDEKNRMYLEGFKFTQNYFEKTQETCILPEDSIEFEK